MITLTRWNSEEHWRQMNAEYRRKLMYYRARDGWARALLECFKEGRDWSLWK